MKHFTVKVFALFALVFLLMFGLVWFIIQSNKPKSSRLGTSYDPTIRLMLPVEAFGTNWRVQNFRRNVLFPDNFDVAMTRAINAANTEWALTGRAVQISFAPRT